MKTKEELEKIITESKAACLAALPGLKQAIEESDWEEVIEYANSLVVGACCINIAEGVVA